MRAEGGRNLRWWQFLLLVLVYLTRRWAGTIWLAMPVHGSQDFVILSGQIGVDAEASPLAIVLFPTMIGLAILLYRRRHRIDPE